MSTHYDPDKLAGTGRHLSPAELKTWTRFLDSGRLLEEILARHVTRDHGMTHSDYEVLVRLDGAGGEMRMTTLADLVVSVSGEHADLIKQFLLDLLTIGEQEVIAETMDRVSAHLRIHRGKEPCPRCQSAGTAN